MEDDCFLFLLFLVHVKATFYFFFLGLKIVMSGLRFGQTYRTTLKSPRALDCLHHVTSGAGETAPSTQRLGSPFLSNRWTKQSQNKDDDFRVALYVCPNPMNDGIHSGHRYLEMLEIRKT